MAHFIPWEDISLNEDPGDEKLWLTKLHFGLFSLQTETEKKNALECVIKVFLTTTESFSLPGIKLSKFD